MSGKALLALGVLGGAAYLLTRPSKSEAADIPDDGEPGSSYASLRFIPGEAAVMGDTDIYSGRAVPSFGPNVLVSGSKNNQLVAKVTNGSVYTGTTLPAPYRFAFNVRIVDANGNTILYDTKAINLGKGETKEISFSFDLPYDMNTTGPGYAMGLLLSDASHCAEWGTNGVRRAVTPNGKGDINGDGYVDAADVHAIEQIIFGLGTWTAKQIAAAEVNGDGITDMGDVTSLEYYITGLTSYLGPILGSGFTVFTVPSLAMNVIPAEITPGGTVIY
jgi:hypothetical protein